MQLASYLERGPLMWMMPLHLHVNQKSDYDMMIYVGNERKMAIKLKGYTYQITRIVAANIPRLPYLVLT